MPNDSYLEQYDHFIRSTDWLKDQDLPIAITLEEVLEPALGPQAVIFPPTFAVDKKDAHPYQIDILDQRLTAQEAAASGMEANCCQIDGVGSQANRMESMFKFPPLSSLVPQVTIRLNDGTAANLVDVGHRIADGAIRFSSMRDDVTSAIKELRDQGSAGQLAQLAPTSLLFGFWDSRPETTLFKFGRTLSSTILATNVEIVHRSAQFNPVFDPANIGLADLVPQDEDGESTTSAGKAADGKDPMSKLGLRHVPAVKTHGGVRVYGRIVRRTQINLARLRSLAVSAGGAIDSEASLRLRRYILGLGLVAGGVQSAYNLREGCLLRVQSAESQLVFPRHPAQQFSWEILSAFDFAKKAADNFGVGSDREVQFDPKAARQAADELRKAKKK